MVNVGMGWDESKFPHAIYVKDIEVQKGAGQELIVFKCINSWGMGKLSEPELGIKHVEKLHYVTLRREILRHGTKRKFGCESTVELRKNKKDTDTDLKRLKLSTDKKPFEAQSVDPRPGSPSLTDTGEAWDPVADEATTSQALKDDDVVMSAVSLME